MINIKDFPIYYISKGKLHYSRTKNSGWRAVVNVDQDLADYYRSLIPKWVGVSRPGYAAHITVVRPEKQSPRKVENWRKYHNQEVEFIYSPEIVWNDEYFWIHAFSRRLEDVRRSLGLDVYKSGFAPPGYTQRFHITIARRQ